MMEHVDTMRFLARLDACFAENDLKQARIHIAHWEQEARRLGDDRGLLTILNEAVGVFRRTQKKSKALAATNECLHLIEKLGLYGTLSGATILVNAATTLSFFGNEEQAILLYDEAADCFEKNQRKDTFEYASLLNNRAGTFYAMKRYDEAEKDWKTAIEILRKIDGHDGEIAISLVMLAHVTFDRDETAYDATEALLDEAWECINAESQPRDGNYAYVLRKCAPSFDYFQRPIEAQALREVAQEIYAENRL